MDLGGSLRKQTLKNARLFVTTLRLCVVAPAATASGLQSMDMPLQCISEESFKQPIFGANSLVGRVAPVPGRGLDTPASFQLYFYKGGCGTFLRILFHLLGTYRESGCWCPRVEAPLRSCFADEPPKHLTPKPAAAQWTSAGAPPFLRPPTWRSKCPHSRRLWTPRTPAACSSANLPARRRRSSSNRLRVAPRRRHPGSTTAKGPTENKRGFCFFIAGRRLLS